jgi:hypothetical protein
MSDTTSKELLIELNKYVADEDMPVVKQLIKQYGIQERIDQMEETKYAIMRGEYGHSEVAIIEEFDERITELTALKEKENK